MHPRIVVALGLAACAPAKARQLDRDLVRVSVDARLRTDTVGGGAFEEQATFVLVDADNTSREGADITLGGDLADAGGKVIGELRPQTLWIPAGATRTFALVDRERKPRPAAVAAQVRVHGATIPDNPPATHVDELRELEDQGRTVVQGVVRNDATRAANIMVIASFHDVDGRPLTRPFAMVRVGAHDREPVQFIGPPGATHGTIFVGDVVY